MYACIDAKLILDVWEMYTEKDVGICMVSKSSKLLEQTCLDECRTSATTLVNA